MKKLLILLLEDDILQGVLSWPRRELDAKVLFYKTAADVRRLVQAHEPDVVLLDEPCPPVLDEQTRSWIREGRRSVRVVWDASDTAWHCQLEKYAREEVFDLVIAADGALDWPHRECDLSMPTPVDPVWYEGERRREVKLGFSGSCGNAEPRKSILGDLQADGLLTLRLRGPENRPYQENAEFYMRCRSVLNVAHTTCGTLQCKARAIEAALAGCLLFETKGSPLSKWLQPGIHYVEYDRPEQVREQCCRLGFDERCAEMGARARERALALDLPRTFWGKVMGDG